MKSIYGLNQYSKMWYQKFDTQILGPGFARTKVGHCVYCKYAGEHFVYVMLYVDDMLVGNNIEVIKEVKLKLSSKFYMMDLNATNFILGVDIKRDRGYKKFWLKKNENQTKMTFFLVGVGFKKPPAKV